MGGVLSLGESTASSPANMAAAQGIIRAVVANERVVVFSKTWCGYCTAAKDILRAHTDGGEGMKVFELDQGAVEYDGQEASGSDVQGAINAMYKQRTVPAVFINGQLLGGHSDTAAAERSGKLDELLAAQS